MGLKNQILLNLNNMAESLFIPADADKTQMYETLCPQVASLVEREADLIANLANIAAVLKQTFDFYWVGFYRVSGDQLVLGPFQGPLACTRIARGRGVCGSAWLENRTLCVPDVEQFPGHIACSSDSRSEIVVPFRNSRGEVAGVLDIDSDRLQAFDAVDAFWLEKLVSFIPVD